MPIVIQDWLAQFNHGRVQPPWSQCRTSKIAPYEATFRIRHAVTNRIGHPFLVDREATATSLSTWLFHHWPDLIVRPRTYGPKIVAQRGKKIRRRFSREEEAKLRRFSGHREQGQY